MHAQWGDGMFKNKPGGAVTGEDLKAIFPQQGPFSGFRVTGLLLLSDSAALLLVWCLSVVLRYALGGSFSFALYWDMIPLLLLFPAAYAIAGLYPGILLSPPEELKKITQSTSVVFLILLGAIFLSKQSDNYSRGIFVMAWLGVLAAVPFFRTMLRRKVDYWKRWGHPAVILGAGKTGEAVAEALAREHRLCLRPVAFFDDDPEKIGKSCKGLPVIGPLDAARNVADACKGATAIVAMPGAGPAKLVEVLQGPAADFRRLIIIPDLFGASSLWISAFDMGGILGLEVHQKLLDPRRQWIKRIAELALILLFSPLILLLSAIIAVVIKLDSKGPVLFGHKRIGLDGNDITIWKFRTMVQDAGDVLVECLQSDPALRAEWEEKHKLTCDPRITKVGHFLRRTSLDELPQLWNVLRGDLSLVGPRPIVWDEVDKYEGGFVLYKKVKPGLTGLWQVSGRSGIAYSERVRLDAFYVRNWSVWLDIYILLKTPGEVFRCRGAC
jgi:Undecaprenyl-phosphate galactose phosphotransferase WbaP